jgi:hypothetical protein
MGTVGRDKSFQNVINLNTYDEQNNETSDSYRSSSATIYNPTYHPNDTIEEPVFDIFYDLERSRKIGRHSIPQTQMANMADTFSSFPHNQIDNRSKGIHSFSDSDEIEFVTDMLDDMTKDDDMQDEFIEALNPNIIIPRTKL